MDRNFADNDYCFACGELNTLGIHLKFEKIGEELWTRFYSAPHLQGFGGVLHGGVIAVVLDDTMSNAVARFLGRLAVTAEFSVRFKKPAPAGIYLRAVGRVEKASGKVFKCSSRLMDDDSGEVLAVATATLIEVGFRD